MDWQAQYASGETPWDKGAPHPAIVDFIAASGPFTGRILIPGCGAGHDVRAVSTAANEAVGLDLAPGAADKARTYPRTGNETYMTGDLLKLGPQFRASFDWVVEHTCFCAIDPALRPAYAEAVAAALKPGARIFAIFYLNPGGDREGPPFGVAVAELDQFFSPFFAVEQEWVPARTFEGREDRELVRILRRL